MDRRLARDRPWLIWVVAMAAAWGAASYLARHGILIMLAYALLGSGRAFAESPWWLRRVRRRAEAAVVANA